MVLGINDYKILCNKGSATYNEDIVGFTPFGAWVLDGATGLNNKNIVSKESDAKWYVSWWNKYLHENIMCDKSLKIILKEGIDKITQEYMKKVGDLPIEELYRPSSSALIIKFHEDKLEYLLLGDCTLIYEKENEQYLIKDESVCKFDEKVFKFMDNIKDAEKLTLEEKKLNVMSLIIENRLKKNSSKGYWILEFCKDSIDHAIYGHINFEKNLKILLCSDGFSCAFDKYYLYKWKDILKVCYIDGVDHIYEKIRKVEFEDKNALKYPRFKISDDSSCIYLSFNRI